MEISEIKQIMNQNAERICRELLPGGKKDGKNWCCGSIQGEKGRSLKVCLTGKNAGAWSDFESGAAGDLIGLWKQVRHRTLVDALEEIKRFLPIHEPAFLRPGKKYSRPTPPINRKAGQVVDYLTKERKLTLETLKAFRVESDGEFYFLPSYRGDELVHWKKISIHRDEKGKKKIFTAADTEPCLFGWQALDPDATEIFITEGEIDAMSIHQYGGPALSVPFGAGTGEKLRWIETEYPHLERFEDIYLCFDNDEAGQECVQEIASRLGLHRCKVIKLPMKDANECLKAGLTADDLSPAISNPEEFQPEKLRNANAYLDDVLRLFLPGAEEANGIPLPFCKNGEFRFRRSEITVWTGINGHGKSLMLGQIMLELMLAGERVCVASMEMRPKITLERLVKQTTAIKDPSVAYINQVFEWFSDNLWIYDHLGSADTADLLQVFAYARRRYGVTQFVIDSLMRCGIATDDYNRQKAFVDSLCNFKHQYDCHVHLVAHPRKLSSEYEMPDKQDVSGSGDITNLVDNQISVWRNKRKEEEAAKSEPDPKVLKKPDGFLIIQKQRNKGWEGTLPLWFDRESQQFLTHENQKPKRYVNYSKENAHGSYHNGI